MITRIGNNVNSNVQNTNIEPIKIPKNTQSFTGIETIAPKVAKVQGFADKIKTFLLEKLAFIQTKVIPFVMEKITAANKYITTKVIPVVVEKFENVVSFAKQEVQIVKEFISKLFA